MKEVQNEGFSLTRISSISHDGWKNKTNASISNLSICLRNEPSDGMLHLHKTTTRGRNLVSFQDQQRGNVRSGSVLLIMALLSANSIHC